MTKPTRHTHHIENAKSSETSMRFDRDADRYVAVGGRTWVRHAAQVMLVVLLSQSAMAAIPAHAQTALPITPNTGAPAGQRPIIDAAQNGVPIVHIAPPSAAGVSRNQYNQFNVNPNGLILNNSPTSVQTQQGGWISGNLQLGATPARIILNEVVTAHPSQLRGAIEVAGQRADIVIANPNGITCNGCGFLNTSRATLTTGQTQFGAGGAIQGFDVRQGQLTIGGNGLNASNLEQLDLIARGVVIEGEVWAKNLNVIAGANTVLYGTLQAAVQTGTGAAPRFAIDIKDLGGMYANQIYLVSTEQGLGVNSTGRMAALQGNLVLAANGDLTLQHSYAKQNIQINGAGNVQLAGQTQSEGATAITAAGALTNLDKIDSAGKLTLAGNAIANTGSITQRNADGASLTATGQVANSGAIYSAGQLNMSGDSIADNNGNLQASGNLTLQAKRIALAGTQISTDANATIAATGGNLAALNARIHAGNDLDISATGALDGSGSNWQAARNATMQGTSVTNRNGTVLANGQLNVNTSGVIDNTDGKLQATGNVALNGQRLLNTRGQVASDANAGVQTSAGIDNQSGVISAKANLALATQAGVLDNAAGTLIADAGLAINGGAMINDGGTVASRGQQNGVLDIAVSSLSNRQGTIDAAGALALVSTGAVDNSNGAMLSGTAAGAAAGGARITAASVNNAGGRMVARDAMTVAAGSLNNDKAGLNRGIIASSTSSATITAAQTSNIGGLITGATANTINTQALDNSGGELSSGANLSINTSSRTLTNNGGTILGGGNITIRAGDVSSTTAARIAAAGAIDIQAGSLNNDGSTVSAGRNAAIALGGGTLSNNGGAIEAGGALTIGAGALNSQSGRILSDATVSIQAASVNTTGATVSAANAVTIASANAVDNTGGSITSNGNVSIAAGTLNNTAGVVSALQAADIRLAAGLLDNSAGRLIGSQTLSVQSGEIRNAAGTIATAAALTLDTQNQALNNTGGGQIVSNGDLRIRSGRFTNNGGTAASILGALDVGTNGQSLNNDGGRLQAQGDVTLASGAAGNQSGLISGRQITVNSAAFNNDNGVIAANTALNITSQALSNNRGLLQGATSVSVNTQGQALTNTNSASAGGIVAGSTLAIAAGSLDNKGGFIASNANQTLTIGGNLDNSAAGGQAGQIVSNANSTITAATITSIGGSIGTLGNLAINTGALDNRSGQIAANGDVALTLASLDNRMQGGVAATIDAANINIAATSIDNTGGVVRAARDATVTAAALDNSNGAITAKRNLAVAAAAFTNAGGRLVGDNAVALSTSSQSLGGTMASANNVALTVAGDFNNTGLLSAQNNLTLNAGNITNSGTLKAGQTLTATTGNLTNSGEISGQTVILNASGTLTNTGSGLIDGVDTRVNAATINNAGRIYGDWLRISGGTLNNSATGAIAARDTLLIGMQNMNNTDGGLIYSQGDIGIAGSIDGSGQLQGSAQSVLNASSKIEAGRNLVVAAASIVNRNDRLVTRTVTDAPVAEDKVQSVNSATRYPLNLCSGIGGGQDGNSCIVHPDKYGQRSAIVPVFSQVCTTDGDSNQVCTTQTNYQWNSPVFAQYQVTPPSAPPTAPAGGCSYLDSNTAMMVDVISTACNQWRSDNDAWNVLYQAALTQLTPKVDAYNAEVNEDNRLDQFEDYTLFRVTSAKTRTELVSSDPGKILAGGGISLNGAVTNRDSQIVAGGALSVVGPLPANLATQGETRTDYSGTTQSTRIDPCGTFGGRHCRKWDSVNPYNPAPDVGAVDLPTVRYEAFAGNQTVSRTLAASTAVADTSTAAANLAASGNGRGIAGQALQAALSTGPGAQGAAHAPPVIVRVAAAGSGARSRDVILSTPAALTIPQNSLFALQPQPNARYLVETDARFTNFRTFIGSDYFLQALKRDPERQLKRYGDGFVEQQLINDQILTLTGRRYLTGYSNTEDEYKALMNAGVAYANQYQLTPGVALSAEQMALLTTDIVWLTTRTVTLADGSTQQVLAPQVYLRRPQGQDLQQNGSLMAATDIFIKTEGELVNSGAIAGNTVTAIAGTDLINRDGRISGQTILLRASNDLKNLSGTIQGIGADSSVTLLAGRDVVLQTRTAGTVNNDGSSTRTSVQRVATVQGGTIRLDAGRDLLANGAAVAAEGNLIATAGRDISVGTVAGQYQLAVADRSGRVTEGRTAYLTEAATRNQSSSFTAGNNIALAAAGDARFQGATLAAGANNAATGNLLIQAQNIQIEAATDRTAADLQTIGVKSYRRVARDDETLATGTITAGNNLTLRATGAPSLATASASGNLAAAGNTGGNITLTGASLAAQTGQVTLDANNDITIQNAVTRHAAIDDSYSKSGDLLTTVTTTRSSSKTMTVAEGGSVSGNSINLQAGRDLTVQGSAIAGDGNVTLGAGNNIAIVAATATRTDKSSSKVQENGFLSGGGFGISYGQRITTVERDTDGATQSGQERSLVGSSNGNLTVAAGKTLTVRGSDLAAGQDISLTGNSVTIDPGRDTTAGKLVNKMEQNALTVALGGTVVNAIQTLDSLSESAGKTKNSRVKALAAATAALAAARIAQDIAANGANVSISATVGQSKSEQTQTTASSNAIGSTVAAGRNLTIAASGAGQDSNLAIIGSDLSAKNNISLTADNKINLTAAQDTEEQRSRRKSMSAAAGVAASIGTSGMALGVNASLSTGRGQEDGSGTTQRNTRVAAGNQLAMNSGGDTTIQGAVASGKQVTADVQGNLNLESLQDTARFDSKSQDINVSATVGFGASVSASFNRSKIKSDYASVQEQSGILAGDGGFDIQVKGNTDLKGAVISSTQSAIDNNRNRLTTATLTQSDIQNRSVAEADSMGVSASASISGGDAKDGGKGKGPGGTDLINAGGGPNIANSKYEAGKAVIGNLLNNGSESRSSSGVTRSAISAGVVIITDDKAQQAKTGKTGDETVASINRNTATANTVVQKQDVQEMKQAAEAERMIKQEAVKQASVITDAVYRSATGEKKIMLQKCDPPGGDCRPIEVDMKGYKIEPGPDGKVYIFNHGIMNTEAQALENAAKQSQPEANQQGVYVVINPHTGSVIGEVVYAAWDKVLAPVFGISNAAEANIDLINKAKEAGAMVEVTGHSRGGITIDNFTDQMRKNGETQAPIINVQLNGSAANAQNVQSNLDRITSGQGQVNQSTHQNDLVGRVIGGNVPTGGLPSSFEDAHTTYGPNVKDDDSDRTWGQGIRSQSLPARSKP